MTIEKNAVLLIAHGSPERAEDVPVFLRNVTSGRAIPDTVMQEVQHRYRLIGRSPLNELTRLQAKALSQCLEIPVYVGMRNWHPYLSETIQQMIADGVTRAAAICLAPQNSRTSVGLYRQAVFAEATDKIEINFIDSWHDHPLLIQAFAERLLPRWRKACKSAGEKVPVIFTAHSVPVRTIEDGDPYEAQCKQTGALVAKKIGLEDKEWKFAFQSQGLSGGAWIGPAVEDTILQLKAAGRAAVLLQPVGFVCDHVEVLYDIDIHFKDFAQKHGMQLLRAESLNDSPIFIAALAGLAKEIFTTETRRRREGPHKES